MIRWSAFVFYLYTGDVNFAPLTSQTQVPRPSNSDSKETTTADAPRCSPKSMYRLADEVSSNDFNTNPMLTPY